ILLRFYPVFVAILLALSFANGVVARFPAEGSVGLARAAALSQHSQSGWTKFPQLNRAFHNKSRPATHSAIRHRFPAVRRSVATVAIRFATDRHCRLQKLWQG